MDLQLDALHIDPSWLDRSVNEGFSGGERKRNEVLQLAVLEVSTAPSVPGQAMLAGCRAYRTEGWPQMWKPISNLESCEDALGACAMVEPVNGNRPWNPCSHDFSY